LRRESIVDPTVWDRGKRGPKIKVERQKQRMGTKVVIIEKKKAIAYLQIRARMSPLPVAKRLPVGAGATEMTVRGELETMIDEHDIARRLGQTRERGWIR
jgi:hypothetical protein